MRKFSNSVIYQIYPKSFKDSNHDGLGDLKGIIEKLDYIEELGVDYIWITPVFESPQNDNGYDISNYLKIDDCFGTMEDLENLIAESNSRNIGIMLDMVFNHTSTSHEWFKKAIDGDEKYQKYYIFREGRPDEPPTNWVSKFGGSSWEYVHKLGKWYLHLFDVSQADLNWDNPEVRKELEDVIIFWKKKGISAFRFDVINLISKSDKWQDDLSGDGRKYYTDGPHVHDYIKELVKNTGIENMVTVGEMSSTTIDNCIKYSSPKEKELSMCFSFHHLKVDYNDGDKWSLMEPDYNKLIDLLKDWQLGMQKGDGWNALFWCNHDQPRIVSRLGNEKKYWEISAKMLAAVIHLMRGTPYIYQGEEIGMLNAHFDDIESYRDVESLNYYDILLDSGIDKKDAIHILQERSRDNSRTPMQWSNTLFAGFSDCEPWISIPDNFKYVNVKLQEERDSVLSFYKELIRLRKTNELISEGDIEFVNSDNEGIIIYRRKLKEIEESELIVVANFREANNNIKLQMNYEDLPIILSNYLKETIDIEYKGLEAMINLRPYELVVFEKKK